MSSDNNVVISPEVHKPRLELMKAPVGCTITEILRCAIREGKFDASDLPYVEIRINGKLLPRREDALDRCLLNNEIVQISMAVRGDNPLKNAFQLIVQVTAIVVGFYFGPWAAAAVQIAGGLATAALFRNKQDRLADPNSSSALNEQSNQIRRRAPMPLVLGKQRIGFDVAALSYTQNIGNDSWLNVIFGVHYGPCVVDDIKIGETLLRDYPASDYQIEYFLNPGPRNSNLYPGNVFQENFNNKLEFVGIPGGTWEVITPLPGAKGADVDFTLPAGLSYSTDKGKIRNEEVAGQIQIAEVGTENWQPAPFPGHNSARDKNNQLLPPGSWYLNMKTANAIRMTKSFALDPSKNWKIRVRAYDRDNDPSDDPGHTWDTYLTALRSKFDGRPIIDENLACIVLRIKASGDLGNTLPVVSGEATPIVPVFKNGNWDTREPSSNQAALLRWCLTDLPAARPLNQDQINSTCASVYNLIEARNWEAALHITEEISQEDLMRLCGLAGRFATYWSGEDLCFVGDWEKPIARQIFSAANIQGYKYRREFQDEIHAVLVEFKNVDQDSRADELWVYADGYDSTNATLFETYTLQYACKKDRAYREGRVYLARRELKSETHEWTCAFDSVTSTFGDRVRLSHYSALYGQDSGRVVNRIFNGDKTLVIGIRVDFEAEQISGTSYSVDVRRSDTALVGLLLEPVTGDVSSKNLYFAVPIPVANAPRKDDLVVFGETNLVTEDVEIDSFEPQSRNEVRISASPYVATQIEAAETGPIPSLPTNLLPKPQVPRVRILQRYGNPEGVEVVFDIEIKDANTIRGFVARWRYSGPDSPWNTIGILPPEARNVRTPPIQRPAYDPDDPIDAITYVDVQIVTLSMRGDYSQPATANNIEVRKEVQKLTGFDAIGVGRPAPDGSSKAAIAVIADPVTAGDIQYLDVEAAVLAQDAEYVSLGSLPASNPIGDFTEIDGGQDYVVRGRWRTQDNWYSDWEYVGLEGSPVHVPGGQNVANDTVNIGGRPVADVIAELTSVGQLVNDTAQAVQDLQDLYGDTASAAASAAAAAASEAAATQAKADAVIAKGEAQTARDAAATKATEAAGSASSALTSKNDAAASATTATNKAADATNAAASATTQAGLAAGSATAAGGSATAAAGSASTAATKATEAGNSAAAANAAKVAAESARDTADQKATAAASSAASAATSSTQAGQSASAAQTAKTDAETARAQAQTSASNAADAVTNAAGSAATATQQAGLATTARNDAAGSASAALTSRNQASGFATAAETAAAASSASSVTATTASSNAQGVADRLMPDRVSQVTDFSLVGTGQPSALPNLASPSQGSVVSVTGEGDVWQTTLASNLYSKGWRPVEDGRTYAMTVRQRVTVDGPGNFTSIFMQVLDSAGATLGQLSLAAPTLQVSQGWVQTRVERTAAQIRAAYPNAAFIRSRVQPNRGTSSPSGATTQFSVLRLEDATQEVTARGHASAAATSAANAAASETAAGQSASAASTAKTQAETARGQAQTAATQASNSRDDAAGSAASASSSATNAANSRDAAAGSASAAAGSASTASTKAGEAGTHAAAALASQVTASTARDEALQALMQQGRTNLVARENVTPGSPVTSPSPSTSGWGFTLTGTGSGQERSITVGPLKQSTPYSVSFKARRSIGTGASSLNIDLYPDTLPERVFQIDENWKDFKWEGLTSSHPDMTLPNVRLRFFRSPLASGVQFEITDIKLEEGATATAWTPSPKDAPASAQAAATSASSASASETAAGASANSASGSATTATTAAGQAQTYSNQASSSATAAAGSATTASQASGTAVSARDAAIGARNDAQGAAATAIAQASSASASAASAQISADLAASVGTTRPNLLTNGGLENNATGMSGSGPLDVSDDPAWGRNIKNWSTNSGTHSILWPSIPVRGNAQYTVSGDTGYFHTGTGGNSYLDMIFYDAGGAPILDGPQKSINGPHDFSNEPERLQAHAVSVVAPSNAATAQVRAIFTNMNAPTFMGARRVKVEEGSTPATAFTNEASTNQISAQLQITASTTADLATRMAEARFEVTAAAGGNLAQLKIRADTSGSLAGLVAQAVSFSNTVSGTVVEVMKIIGGSVFITGPVYIGSNKEIELNPISTHPHIAIKVGTGRMAMGRLPNDNLIYWFGASQEVSNMNKNNATEWRDSSGNAYFGGSLSIGTLTNKAAASSLAVGVEAETVQFGSDGGRITVNASASFSSNGTRWSNTNPGDGGGSNGPTVVQLFRRQGAGAYAQVGTFNITGSWERKVIDLGADEGPGRYRITTTSSAGGAITFTDPSLSTQDRQYKLVVSSRTNMNTAGAGATTSERLTLIATE